MRITILEIMRGVKVRIRIRRVELASMARMASIAGVAGVASAGQRSQSREVKRQAVVLHRRSSIILATVCRLCLL